MSFLKFEAIFGSMPLPQTSMPLPHDCSGFASDTVHTRK